MQKCQEEHQEQKLYFSFMDKVGSWNRYQLCLFLILYGVGVIRSALIYVLPFLFQQINYQCQQTEDDLCSDFVCSLPSSQRASYLNLNHYRSLSDDLKLDFRCQYYETLSLLYAAALVSIISGKFIFSIFAEKFGRKKTLVVATSIMLCGLMITLLSGYIQSLSASVVGIMIACLGSQNAIQCIYCIITEVVSEHRRVACFEIISTVNGVGNIMNVLVFWLIKDWMHVYIFVFVVPLLALLFAAINFMEKTPIDLLTTQSPAYTLEVLKRIANFNGIEISMTVSEVEDIKNQYSELMAYSSKKSFTVLDIFKYLSLRKSIIQLAALNFVSTYLLSSAPLLLDNSPTTIANPLAKNQIKGSIIDGSAWVLAILLIFVFYDALEKKRVRFFIGAIIFSIQLYFLSFSGEDDIEGTRYYFYFCYAVLVSGSFVFVNLMNSQMFPTQIRATGIIFLSLFQDFGDLIQTLVNKLYETSYRIFVFSLLFFTVIYIVIMFSMDKSKEAPPEIIEEILQQDERTEQK